MKLTRQNTVNQISTFWKKNKVTSMDLSVIQNLVSLASSLPSKSSDINKLEGADFDNGIIYDMDELLSSSYDHSDSIIRHAFSSAPLILAKQHNGNMDPGLASEYNNLVEMLESIDHSVLNRSMCISSSRDGVIESIKNDFKTEQHGSEIASILDYRLEDGDLYLWYPIDFEDEIKDIVESKAVEIKSLNSISPLIPGMKDFKDVEAKIEIKKSMDAEFNPSVSL